MITKPKRRYSDSDVEPANPFLTASLSEPKHQTVPTPFSATSASNPFITSASARSLRPLAKSQRPRLSLAARGSSDACKLRARDFDPSDPALTQKIRKEEECGVRVFRERGYAVLTFESPERASEVLQRGLAIEGHPSLLLSPYQKAEKKKNVFERLDKPKQPHVPSAPPLPVLPHPPLPVHHTQLPVHHPPLPVHHPQLPVSQPVVPLPTAVFSATQSDPRQGRGGREDSGREEALYQLEQRDLALRERSKQGETLVGTCGDMCPEKERFWREERRCLSSYELLPGPGYAVDHSAAIKEFSRNAADKSQPLPHELRTPDALERTLLHLCHRIMPTQPRSREWHGFLSNRLESLRQDMTIQHLCSLRSVRVLEACARYHALSAHLLLGAEVEAADLEMNDMKLRSILAPLLQMYRDLRPEGVRSPDEPAFVSLSLVLAIEADLIAYDLTQVSDDVIAAPPVQLVLRVWQAVHGQDYARFFQLLRQAGFLTGSLLNRFVPDLRLKALQLMSSSASKQGDHVVTGRLTQLLCFDDVTQCVAVCSQAGLQCDTNRVQLSGPRQLDPSSVRGLPLSLIRDKCSCDLGEAVYGGPLPPLPPYTPAFASQPGPPPPEAAWESAVAGLSAQELESLLATEIELVVGEVLGGVQRCQVISELSEQLSTDLLNHETAESVSEVLRCEVAREKEQRRRRQERAEFMARTQVELFDQLFIEVVGDVTRCEVDSAREHRAIVSRAVTSLSEESYREQEEEVLHQLISGEVASGVQAAKQRRKERLEETRVRVRGLRLRNKWTAWRDAFLVRERRRESVRRFPIQPPDRVDRGQWSLGPTPALREKVPPGGLERVSAWLRERRERKENERSLLSTPICIPELLGSTLVTSRCQEKTRSVDWLLLLLVTPGLAAADWLVQLLGVGGGEGTGGQVRTLSDRETRDEERHTRVRVRLVEGPCHPSHLKGCSAVLLLAAGANPSAARERLELLRGVKPTPQFPLFVLHTEQPPSRLRPPACVSEVATGPLPRLPSLTGKRALEQSLVWLAERAGPQPLLVRRCLREFVGDRMYALFSLPAAQHASAREQLGVSGATLESLRALFDVALSCVKEQLTGRWSQGLSWPIRGDGDAWRWNEEERLKEVAAAVNGLRLKGESSESLEEFLSECQPLSPSLLSECHSLHSRHLARLKRMGLPLCPPWAQILETLMSTGMQSPEFDGWVYHESGRRAGAIRLPQEWLRSLEELSHRSACIAPALRRKMNSQSEARERQEAQKRKRHSDPLTPLSPQGLARKTARLDLERSLARLEGLVREEVSRTELCTEQINSLIRSADSPVPMTSWEEQLERVEEELRALRDSF